MSVERKRSAKFEAALFEGDDPLVVLLTKAAGKGRSYFLASAIPDIEGDLDYYFCVSVKPGVLKRYLRNQCDLRYVYTFAPQRSYFRAEKHEILSEKVSLVAFSGDLSEDLLPAGRFFASDHTTEYGLEETASYEETLFVDGDWEMSEFGDFYRRFADLYAYFASAMKLSDPNVSDRTKEKVKGAITSKPFKGGSSYLGLFSDLFKTLSHSERPGLDSINYASPGQVEIRGIQPVFDALEDAVENYLANTGKIVTAHDDLRKYMSETNLLKIGARTPSLTGSQATILLDKCKLLYRELDAVEFEKIHQLSDSNLIVTAKIALAVYRRLEFSGKFFAQGRIGYSQD